MGWQMKPGAEGVLGAEQLNMDLPDGGLRTTGGIWLYFLGCAQRTCGSFRHTNRKSLENGRSCIA